MFFMAEMPTVELRLGKRFNVLELFIKYIRVFSVVFKLLLYRLIDLLCQIVA